MTEQAGMTLVWHMKISFRQFSCPLVSKKFHKGLAEIIE